MKETKEQLKWEILSKRMKKEPREYQNASFQFYHYTSLPNVFNILEGDSFWAANARFSNDKMEEKMLETEKHHDDYIICFCGDDDLLSQWRGYCHNGGASLKLEIRAPREYSVLHADYEKSGKYELYKNAPLPVVYVPENANPRKKKDEVKNDLSNPKYRGIINVDDVLPYFKNCMFFEEKESRLVFSNSDNILSKCIRFRTISDGVMVPYIVVKIGDVGKMKTCCKFDVYGYDDEKLEELALNGEAIWIDEGYNQETKYYEMMKRIEQYKVKNPDAKINVFCKGHLPVSQIKVAPSYNTNRIAEQIKRYCMSKYWLRNVVVNESKIPYIQPTL